MNKPRVRDREFKNRFIPDLNRLGKYVKVDIIESGYCNYSKEKHLIFYFPFKISKRDKAILCYLSRVRHHTINKTIIKEDIKEDINEWLFNDIDYNDFFLSMKLPLFC